MATEANSNPDTLDSGLQQTTKADTFIRRNRLRPLPTALALGGIGLLAGAAYIARDEELRGKIRRQSGQLTHRLKAQAESLTSRLPGNGRTSTQTTSASAGIP